MSCQTKTIVRHAEFKNIAKVRQSIQGYDANGLYLSCIMESMPTEFFIRYHNDNDFQPVLSQKLRGDAVVGVCSKEKQYFY